MNDRIRFRAPEGDPFAGVLRRRVEEHFAATGRSHAGDWRMALKIVGYLGLYAGAWALLIFGPDSLALQLACWVTLGLGIAGIGFNVAHDACHGALSSSRRVNVLLGHTFTLIGVHVYNWKIIHNRIHHAFTNIPNVDGDLHPVPALRYFDDPASAPKRYQRLQHYYAFGLYALASLSWVFVKDYVHFFRREHTGYAKPVPPPGEFALLLASKLIHYGLFIFAPLWAGIPPPAVLGGFIVMHVIAGSALANVFAAGHLVEGTEIVDPDGEGIVRESWLAHQIRTSCNFATKSPFFFWTVGGLNFQIEHHVFPGICHVHYPALAPIVRRTAAEFGVPYQEYPGLGAALASHVRFLKRLGQPRARSEELLEVPAAAR